MKILPWKNNSKEFRKYSYSQCGEDLIITHIFKAIEIREFSYLDIGAHHPYYLNNTALFYKKGHRGINIEPDPGLFKAFEDHRKKDINLNIGIGDKEEIRTFYIMNIPTLNTFSEKTANEYKLEGNFFIKEKKEIHMLNLKNVIEKYANGKIPDFLNIDAEGMEDSIIKSIDFKDNYPIVICVETISFSNTGKGIKNKDLIRYIEDQGYILYADTNINSIFVFKEKWIR